SRPLPAHRPARAPHRRRGGTQRTGKPGAGVSRGAGIGSGRLQSTSLHAPHCGWWYANQLLNQLTANATGLPVVAGPIEATVMGNALVQLITLGEIADLAQAR